MIIRGTGKWPLLKWTCVGLFLSLTVWMLVFAWTSATTTSFRQNAEHNSRADAPPINLTDYRAIPNSIFRSKNDLIAPSWSPRVLKYFYDRVFRYNKSPRPHILMLSRGGFSLASAFNELLTELPPDDANTTHSNQRPLGNTGSDPPEQLKSGLSVHDVVFVFIDGEAHDFDEIVGREGQVFGGVASAGGVRGGSGVKFTGGELSNRLFYWGRGRMEKAGRSIFLPFFVTSFVERWEYSPALLARGGQFEPRQFFAVYMASNCVPMRQNAFDKLYEFAKKNNLGEVHAVGACHGSYKEAERHYKGTERINSEINYMNTASDVMKNYKYSLSFENIQIDGYVTEKLASPLLVNTVPIYLGSRRAKELVNTEAFYYCDDLEEFEKLLVVENFSEEKRKQMVESYKLTGEGIYQFSWHPDVAPIYQRLSGASTTIADDLVDVVMKWDQTKEGGNISIHGRLQVYEH